MEPTLQVPLFSKYLLSVSLVKTMWLVPVLSAPWTTVSQLPIQISSVIYHQTNKHCFTAFTSDHNQQWVYFGVVSSGVTGPEEQLHITIAI